MSANPKTALGILTMAAPIVVLGSICTIATVWYTLSETKEIRTSGSTTEAICTSTYYVQILNGVCTRGQVNGIDPEVSCIQWTDSETWKALDDSNGVSNTAEEVNRWLTVRNLCAATVPLSIINFIVCIVVADVEIELWDIEFDRIALSIAALFNSLIVTFFLITVLISFQADIVSKSTWKDETYFTTDKCDLTAAPSFAYFLLVLGGFFSLVSVYVAVYAMVKAYVLPAEDKDGRGDMVAPIDEEDDDADDGAEDGSKKSIQVTPTGSARPHSPGSVLPAPQGEFTGVMLG